ncbi:MAG: hypothetical protein J6S67_00480 [Methanobrevibacter sp.]|nr:hypothetical protein [Methanobrevibacter sp.]
MEKKNETGTGKYATECLIACLESYMEFIDIMERTLNNFAEMPEKIELMSKTLIAKRRKDWNPILEKLKKDIESKIDGKNVK